MVADVPFFFVRKHVHFIGNPEQNEIKVWGTNFFFREIALTFSSDRIFGQDVSPTNAPCDFLSIEHVFERFRWV